MPNVQDVMTRSLITCSPDTSIAEVARLMRDHDIGDVLVVDSGKLRGIITDRDISVQAVADEQDPKHALVRDYMSTDVITGKPDWRLDRVAKVMGKHQIRRIPITENERVVGIVSLGDIALRQHDRATIANSLHQISESPTLHFARVGAKSSKGRVLLTVLAGIVLAVLLSQQRGRELVEEVLSVLRKRTPEAGTR